MMRHDWRAARRGKQITTGTICHLDAAMIEQALAGWQLEELDLLFIENAATWSVPPVMIWAKNCDWY